MHDQKTKDQIAAIMLMTGNKAKVAEAVAHFRGVDPDDHYKRCAEAFETLRDTIGHGYAEGDIEAITRIVVARLKDWDRLTMFDGKQSYTLTEPLIAAVEATKGRIVTIGVLTDLHMRLNGAKR
ncbi:hypothetical protein F406_gp037 [Agrobacterium phage 7-7-1]|uniref:Uncharacterized protein n=1 Tax=Agrobacterium phage 7-7-1 TaxID=1161931 RepID=J7FAR6_9CAUD|nr:hypothetical protein F406_gp037 [Agrobacterium phage 7-7-1]AFH19778.1 hypothetical protein 7-7-1_00080 [Agrobacterium phage 7-7-1]